MSNEWENLLSEDSEISTPKVLDSKKMEKKEKKPREKKLESKGQDLESKPKSISTLNVEIDPNKILDDVMLWEVLCDLRGKSGVNELFALLTTKTVQSVSHLSKSKTDFKRGKAKDGLIHLFRELKKRGFV